MPKSSAQARNGYIASIRDVDYPVKDYKAKWTMHYTSSILLDWHTQNKNITKRIYRWLCSSMRYLVETRGVEPLSEGTSSRTSPGAVI